MILLCLKIFFARILDVSLGTTRTILVVRNKTLLATVIAFLEVTIWFLVAREALNTEIQSIWIPIAYASGFSVGTLLGSNIAERVISGFVGVQVISMTMTNKDIKTIKDEGFAVTKMKLEDRNKVMLLIQINKKKLKKLRSLLESIDSKAFIIVNDTKYLNNGFVK